MAAPLNSLRILLVDDTPFVISLVRGLLAAAGVNRVTAARNGIEALHLLETAPQDVAFVDWEMEPINGIEFVKAIRGPASPAPRLPLIMLTAHAATCRVLEARAAGVNEYLIKPFTASGVLGRLAAAVNQPRGPAGKRLH